VLGIEKLGRQRRNSGERRGHPEEGNCVTRWLGGEDGFVARNGSYLSC